MALRSCLQSARRGGGAFPEPGDLFESVIEDIYTRMLGVQATWRSMAARMSAAMLFRWQNAWANQVSCLLSRRHPKLARKLVKRARKRRLSQVEVIGKALYDKIGRVPFHWVKEHPAYSGIEAATYDFAEKIHVDGGGSYDNRRDFILGGPCSAAPALLQTRSRGRGDLRALEGGLPRSVASTSAHCIRKRPGESAHYYRYSKEEWFGFSLPSTTTSSRLWGRALRPRRLGPPGHSLVFYRSGRRLGGLRHLSPEIAALLRHFAPAEGT